MNTAGLLQLARTSGAVASSAEALHGVPAGAAETLLWLQPAADAALLARADLARTGRFEALGEVHTMGETPLWRDNPSIDPQWLVAIHQLPMLLDLAHAWSARREPEDLAAWARIAQSWLATMGPGELEGDDVPIEARRVENCVNALLLLRRGGGLRQLPPGLVVRMVDHIAGEAEYLVSRLKQSGRQRSAQLYAVYLSTTLLGPCLAVRSRSRAAAHAGQVRELLAASLLADFGPDGVHTQLAPQAHQSTLRTALAFVALARALDHSLPQSLHRRLRAALEFALWTTLPDGGLPLARPGADASNRPLLALGAALYLLPQFDHVATAGGRGEAPEHLGRQFAQAGYVALRDGWLDAAGAQHLFCDCPALGAGQRSGEGLFSLSYSIGGRQVLVDTPAGAARNTVGIDGRAPGVQPPPARRRAAAAPAPRATEAQPALVRLGTRSALLRGGTPADAPGPAHTRCLAYVMRQYVLLVDRVHADDGAEHQACFTLQFAADWQDRIVGEEDGGRGTVLRGVSRQPTSDWRLLLDAPSGHLHLGSEWLPQRQGRGRPAPCLRATQRFCGEAFFACAIGPQGAACAVHALEARHGAGRSVITVTGESAGRPFVDRLVVHWQEPGLLIRPDYHARAGLALERRVDGALEHLMLAETGEWFTSLRPLHASRVPDAAGDLEW